MTSPIHPDPEAWHCFSLTPMGRRALDLRRKRMVDEQTLEEQILTELRRSHSRAIHLNEIGRLRECDARWTTHLCDDWPADGRYRGVLRVQGSLPSGRRLSIIGSRRADHYGLELAKRIARAAAERDVSVVSGGASGIDMAAHLACAESDGETIVVLGHGVAVPYPRRLLRLKQLACVRIGFVSPFAADTAAARWTFPYRNPWIVALSEAVIVVQAGLRSGALQTADFALKAGVPVWVVTGSFDHPQHAGCRALLRRGAKPLTTVAEWFDQAERFDSASILDLNATNKPKLDLHFWYIFDDKPRTIEAVSREHNYPIREMNAAVTRLEAFGWLRRSPGGYYTRAYGSSV